MEWHNEDKFNSYNSWKGLLYQDHYKTIAEWYKNPETKLLPPIEASIDPSPNGSCNCRCQWCNANRYIGKTPAVSDKVLIDLHKFLIDWGVPSFCEGGAGEPTMRKSLDKILWLIKEHNKQSSIATNGTMFNDKLIDAMANCCRWVGISTDAATSETFKLLKRVDLFSKVLENMSKLVKKTNEVENNCEVSYKFLVTPWNYKEIYSACKIAKNIGVRDFYARAADLSHQGMGELRLKEYNFAIGEIKKQFEKCHQLRTDKFRTFTSVHKFDENFKPYKRFRQCWAMPLLIQCCPDGNVYSCVDQRLQPKFNLGSYSPNVKNILNFWGKEKHYNLTFGNTPKICKSRCTFTAYNEQCEKLFIDKDKDYMCRNFT